MTLLEAGFPYAEVSRLVAADRRSPDSAYQAHRWWARRPPALVRAGLLAATRRADESLKDFWAAYASTDHALAGQTVLDPFMGGGTTLIEASRLGAQARGQDVDPMAVEINRHQVQPPSPDEVRAAGEDLIRYLETMIGHLWPRKDEQWTPLHYFALAKVTCPSCQHKDLLYRSLVIGRSIGKTGAVVREAQVTAFCPLCLRVHDLSQDAEDLTCCGQVHRLDSFTYHKARYHCRCGMKHSHEQLSTGSAPRVLIAVEETRERGYRRIRSAVAGDTPVVPTVSSSHLDVELEVPKTDRRPVSFGIKRIRDLHTDRQAAYLVEAGRWIADSVEDADVARALRLAVSTSIASNNRLCGYATDYGRLAPLFSVRAFSLPALTVELNPLHPSGGRGSLRAALNHVVRSCESQVRRNVLVAGTVSARTMDLGRDSSSEVYLMDSTRQIFPCDPPNLCFTDPPYFDFIEYDALSQVFRAWLPDNTLGGDPLLPTGENGATKFGQMLGRALNNARTALMPGAIIAFTFKGSAKAWSEVASALRHAKLRVTALWPVLADPSMGHHSGSANCEYDLLVVTRPQDLCDVITDPFPVGEWVEELGAVRHVSAADFKSFATAADSLRTVRGSLRAGQG